MTDVAIERPKTWQGPTHAAPIPVVRCRYVWPEGHPRAGDQCRRWSLRGTTVCIKHGAQLPGVKEHAAALVEHYRLRLVDAGDLAIDRVVWLAENASSEAVSLKASETILDRIGVRGGAELDVNVNEGRQDPAELLRDRITQVRNRVVDVTATSSVTEVAEPDDTVSTVENPPHEESTHD